MEMLMDIDLNRSDLFDQNAKFNHSVCSLDVFCCYEPKEYLSKSLGIKATSEGKDGQLGSKGSKNERNKENATGWNPIIIDLFVVNF